MKRSKFTEEQVTYVLRQAESGTAVEDVCRSIGISQATFYIWKKKYGDLGASEVRRLRQLEEENLRLKRLVADLTLDKSILQEVIKKKDLKPTRRRDLAQWIRHTYGVGVEHACELARLSQTAWYYTSKRDRQEGLRMRIREIANARPRFGYERIHVLLQREGWHINVKRVHRLYCLEGLQVRMRRRRKKRLSLHRGMPAPAGGVNERWSMVPQGFLLVILFMINLSTDWLFGY